MASPAYICEDLFDDHLERVKVFWAPFYALRLMKDGEWSTIDAIC
jgi:hypothetical protein